MGNKLKLVFKVLIREEKGRGEKEYYKKECISLKNLFKQSKKF
jgi:hypothetical protein